MKKRNVSLLVLAAEVLAIVVLHAVKISQSDQKSSELNSSISKATTIDQSVRPYQLVSLK